MRRWILALGVLALVAGACSEGTVSGDDGTPSSASPSEEMTASACAESHSADFFEEGTLTVGTDFDFMFPPWILNRKPESGRGFESAVAYEVATRMGFSGDDVHWVPIPFNRSYAPGPKDFDFDINNISVTPERDQAVDFSDGYYDLTQALMVLKGSSIEHATTMEEIKDAIFGAQIGTTSLAFINTVIQPTNDAKVFDSTSDAKAALRNGTVDGLVLDLPTAYFEAYINTPNGALVGQFPSAGEHLGLLFEEGSPLVACANLAIAEMTADGTLEQLQNKWLADYLAVPVIQ
ncbi:MAG TPA: ABC transporter substrate-binding protein [Actinomycetota bacterium]